MAEGLCVHIYPSDERLDAYTEPEVRAGVPVIIYRVEYDGGGTVRPHPRLGAPPHRCQSRTRAISIPSLTLTP